MIDRFLINKRYAKLWVGQTTSMLGDAAFDITLVLWIVTILAVDRRGHPTTWAPIAVGAVMTVMSAAVLLVGPLSGVFVDRWNRRTTMLRTEVVRIVIVGALAVLSFLPVRSLPVAAWLGCIYVVVFAVNGAGQFFNQSRFVVIGDVVDSPEDRARAAGIGQATAGAVSIIGPPLAAPLLITIGLQWALLFNALTYVVSYVMIRSVNLPEGAAAPESGDRPGPWQDFRRGLRWFAGNRYMKRILYGFVIASLGAGSLTSVMVFFLTNNLHSPAKLLGFVDMCFGIGAIAGALVSARLVRMMGARRMIWLGMLIGGAFVLILARQTTFVGGAVLFAAISVPTIAYNTALTPVLLKHTPKEYLGRMQSVLMPVLQLASITSVLVSGLLASTALRSLHAHVAGITIGPYDTIFTASGLLIVIAALYMLVALPRDDAPTSDPVPVAASGRMPEPA